MDQVFKRRRLLPEQQASAGAVRGRGRAYGGLWKQDDHAGERVGGDSDDAVKRGGEVEKQRPAQTHQVY